LVYYNIGEEVIGMYEMEKVLVYPYDIEFSPILRHSKLLSMYNIVALASPNGWGFNGKDAAFVDGGDKLNININNDFEGLLPLCDAVLFTEAERPLDFDKSILPKVIKAAEQGKNILYFRKIEEESRKTLEELCKKNNVSFKSCYDFENTYSGHELDYFKLQKINTPVIFVAGLYEKTQKFEIQLSLREIFSSLGYKVSQVGSRNYCELLGFHSFPKFMYSPSKTEDKKILTFNHFLKDMENMEKPDVIIVGIPGDIMRLNDNFTGRFGTMAYEVAQAVTPDAAIVSTLYENFEPEYFERIATSIKYKLGFDISCFNLSNIKFDWAVAEYTFKESYLLLDSSFVDKKKIKFDMLKTPVFNILNDEDRANMANHLIDILSYYGEVESV
jgi:peptide maturation system protein (TIGR04066 family)